MSISLDQLRMAALMLNTYREMPKLKDILKAFGASRISEIPESERLSCLLIILETKMSSRHAAWRMSS